MSCVGYERINEKGVFTKRKEKAMLNKITKISPIIFAVILLSLVYFQTANDCVLTELSSEEQLSLKEGCDDWDCKNVGKNCLDRIACETNWDCPGGDWACGDTHEEENCVLTQYGWFNCTYDPHRDCNPMRMYD